MKKKGKDAERGRGGGVSFHYQNRKPFIKGGGAAEKEGEVESVRAVFRGRGAWGFHEEHKKGKGKKLSILGGRSEGITRKEGPGRDQWGRGSD